MAEYRARKLDAKGLTAALLAAGLDLATPASTPLWRKRAGSATPPKPPFDLPPRGPDGDPTVGPSGGGYS